MLCQYHFGAALCFRFLYFLISRIKFLAEEWNSVKLWFVIVHGDLASRDTETLDCIGEGYCLYWTILTSLSRIIHLFLLPSYFCTAFITLIKRFTIILQMFIKCHPDQSRGAVLGLVMPGGWVNQVHVNITSCERQKGVARRAAETTKFIPSQWKLLHTVAIIKKESNPSWCQFITCNQWKPSCGFPPALASMQLELLWLTVSVLSTPYLLPLNTATDSHVAVSSFSS